IVIAVVLSWLLGNPMRIRPFAVSKFNTLAQILLAAAVLADEGFALGLGALRTVLVWLTAALTIASLSAYLRAWFRHMSFYEPVAAASRTVAAREPKTPVAAGHEHKAGT